MHHCGQNSIHPLRPAIPINEDGEERAVLPGFFLTKNYPNPLLSNGGVRISPVLVTREGRKSSGKPGILRTSCSCAALRRTNPPVSRTRQGHQHKKRLIRVRISPVLVTREGRKSSGKPGILRTSCSCAALRRTNPPVSRTRQGHQHKKRLIRVRISPVLVTPLKLKANYSVLQTLPSCFVPCNCM